MAYRGVARENHRQRQSSKHAYLQSADRLSAREMIECSACHRVVSGADILSCGSCYEWGCKHCIHRGECDYCRRQNEDMHMMALVSEEDCGPNSDLDRDHDAIDHGLGCRSFYDLEDVDDPPSSAPAHTPDPEGSCYFDEDPHADWLA